MHDQSTDELMIECVRGMQAKMRRSNTQRGANKSVLNQRSLGTIKKRKQEKKGEDSEAAANGRWIWL